jgi:RNA polymerase sigma-70 factor (ECF subfamily)
MRAGDQWLVEKAFTEHGPALVRHLACITHDESVAEDLAQEAFLRLAGAVSAGTTPEDIAGWLHRVGMNLAASRGRHLQVVGRRAGELPRPSSDPDPEALAVRGELVAAVGSVLGALSQPERRALALAAHGFGASEIAASIGRTPGATRTLLCRARGKIRSQVAAAALA